jgi:hypothetical protein
MASADNIPSSEIQKITSCLSSQLTKIFTSSDSIYFDALSDSMVSKFSYENPESFVRDFQARFPNSDFLRKYKIEVNPRYAPKNQYHSSNVCYSLVEINKSSTKKYDRPKKNTYILCPLCDPWRGKVSKDGEDIPKFYDTLHSEYDHHLNQVHGVHRSGKKVCCSFVGFSRSKLPQLESSDYKLCCVCPYISSETSEPCLHSFRLNLGDKDGIPFKAYLRHVENNHYSTRYRNQKAKNAYKYESQVAVGQGNWIKNYFIPFNSEDYFKVKNELIINGNLSYDPIEISEELNVLFLMLYEQLKSSHQFDLTTTCQKQFVPSTNQTTDGIELSSSSQLHPELADSQGNTPYYNSHDEFFGVEAKTTGCSTPLTANEIPNSYKIDAVPHSTVQFTAEEMVELEKTVLKELTTIGDLSNFSVPDFPEELNRMEAAAAAAGARGRSSLKRKREHGVDCSKPTKRVHLPEGLNPDAAPLTTLEFSNHVDSLLKKLKNPQSGASAKQGTTFQHQSSFLPQIQPTYKLDCQRTQQQQTVLTQPIQPYHRSESQYAQVINQTEVFDPCLAIFNDFVDISEGRFTSYPVADDLNHDIAARAVDNVSNRPEEVSSGDQAKW